MSPDNSSALEAGQGPSKASSGARQVWSLDRAALASLLLVLHPEPDQAAVAYESLRQRLIRFFHLHQVSDADGFTDICLDRLAKRIHQGLAVENPLSYAVGIARMLLREERTAQRRRETLVDNLSRLHPAQSEEAVFIQGTSLPNLEQYLEECLQHLAPLQRKQVLLYYSATAREGIDIRQQMAAESDLSLNAFRNRMLRLRKLLEDCLRKRIAARDLKRPPL